jgi:hypothetical protein
MAGRPWGSADIRCIGNSASRQSTGFEEGLAEGVSAQDFWEAFGNADCKCKAGKQPASVLSALRQSPSGVRHTI